MTLENLKEFNNQRGASLIGMAILIICLGAFVTGGIYLYQNYHTVVAEQETKDHKREIDTALKSYMGRMNRLPGPAGLRIAPDAANFGRERLSASNAEGIYRMSGHTTGGGTGGSVLVGAVPVRDLQISDKAMFDGYGKRFVYAVSQNMLGGDADGNGVVSNAEATLIDTDGDGFVSVAEASVAAVTIDVFNDLGAIRVTNPNDDDLRQAPNSIAFTVFSPGEDDRGAFDMQGEQIEGCGAANVAGDLAAGQNCQFLVAGSTATFVTTTDKKFGTGEDFTHSFAFAGNQIPYVWNIDAWGTCNGVCGAGQGTQARTITCVDHKGAVAPNGDADCSHTAKPLESQSCDLASCQWGTHAWTTCAGVCFSGTQTRRVFCVNAAGTEIDAINGATGATDITNADCDNFTEGAQPESIRTCTLPPCRWNTGGWGTCS